MHKSAFETGGLVIQLYGSGADCRILEIGAYDVNGSLREHVGPGATYVGVDIEAGPGVDIVVEPGKPLPFKAQSFDLVLASSVFEHDPAFWATFLELVRVVRRGGHIYINAPSNGGFHRFPEDHWRFYPDSGLALERWAKSRNRPVVLVESFVAEQDDVNWNDFSAIFRRLPSDKPLPEKFLHSQIPSFNVHTWQTTEVIRAQGETQDMLLLAAAQDRVQQQTQALDAALIERDQTREQLDATAVQAAEAERLAEQRASELAEARNRLHQLESELLQRQEEIAQYQSELDAAALTAADLGAVRVKLAESEGWVAELAKFRTEAQKQIAKQEKSIVKSEAQASDFVRKIALLVDELEHRNRQFAQLSAEIDGLRDANRSHLVDLAQTNEEKERLKRQNIEVKHRAEEAESDSTARRSQIEDLESRLGHSDRDAGELAWLRHVHMVMGSQPFWWRLLPPSWRRLRELELLRTNGLFDAGVYCSSYPDVAESGMDPLRHYIWHGLTEGRRRRFD